MKYYRNIVVVTSVLFSILLPFHDQAYGSGTLKSVTERGFLTVGVDGNLFGFSKPDKKAVWRGLDVDVGRAIATAIFNDSKKVKFIPLTAKNRFTALQSGEIDVLIRHATRTLSRETSLGLNFAHVTYFDGQGFLIPKQLGVRSAKELDGATVCVLPGTTTELNVTEYFRAFGMKMKPVVIASSFGLSKAFFSGRCDLLTSDVSQLAAIRAVAPRPSDYIILPEIISREPLAPAVRHGDDQWFDIVNFSVMALIEAEYLGLNSKNINKKINSKNPKIKRFLGEYAGNGKALGLKEKWAFNIVEKVGNYGEIFDRNLGPNTPLRIKRGLNALWTEGGLMYTPPFK